MKFGASTKKEDIANARAKRIHENEQARKVQLEAIKLKQSKIE